MTTTQDLIAQLRALGIPDWAMARVLMTQAADTLEALQAELDEWRLTDKIDKLQRLNEELQRTCDSRGKMLLIAGLYPTCTTEDAKTHLAERDAALAQLAELEKQEPVIYQAKTKPGFLSTSAYAWEDCEKADFLVYEADGVPVRGLYLAAGASPVEPSQAPQGCACRWDAEDNRIATCTRHQGWLDVVQEWADRAKVAEAKLAQPPAPSDTAITYMTGYSDGKEWVGATCQAVELSDEEQVALLRFNETCEDGQGYDVKTSMMSRLAEIGVVSRKFGSVYFVTEYGQRVIAVINAKEQPNG